MGRRSRMVPMVDRGGAQNMGSMWVLCTRRSQVGFFSPIRSGNPLEISPGERCPELTFVRQWAR
jgi:hypothetical protein